MSDINFKLKFSEYDENELHNEISRKAGPEMDDHMHDLLETIKRRMAFNISDGRTSTHPSPVGYTPGTLARSIKYQVRRYKLQNGSVSVRGTLVVGEGVPYARIHDRDGVTTITGPLTFYSHSNRWPSGKWIKNIRSVERPGRPYFDEAVAYGLKRFGIV